MRSIFSFKKFFAGVILAVFLFLVLGNKISAESVNNGSIGYSVAKVPSKNEINSKNSFYDLKVHPKKNYRIAAKIYNATNKSIKVKSSILTTFTNDNGQIAYTSSAKQYDKSLKNKASDFVKIDQKDRVKEIPKKSSKIIHATVSTPRSANGVMLGSWYFNKIDKSKKKKTKGISISNVYTYAMAIKMTSTKESFQNPNLNLLGVKVGLNNYKKVVYSRIQNEKPTIIKNMRVHSTILNAQTGEKVYTYGQNDISMAPNSNFNYSTYASDKLKAGKYILKLQAKANNRTWNWTKNFTITDDQAKDLNKDAKNDPTPPISIWWYVLAIVLGLIFLIGIIWLIIWLILKKKMKE